MSAPAKFFAKPVNNFYILIGSSLALSVIGLVMVFSASSIHSLDTRGNAVAIVLRQGFFFALSIPLAIFLSQRSLAQWRLLSRFGLLISVAILAVLQIPGVGKTVNGNTNWIALPFVDVQPSELAKFLLILWASYLLANQEKNGKTRINVFALITPGFMVVIFLILLGRDLGTACVVAAILGGLLFVSGVELRLLGSLVAAGAVVLAALIATEISKPNLANSRHWASDRCERKIAKGIDSAKKKPCRRTIATALPRVSSEWIEEAEKTITKPITESARALPIKI